MIENFRSIEDPWSISAEELPDVFVFQSFPTDPRNGFWASNDDVVRLCDTACTVCTAKDPWDIELALIDNNCDTEACFNLLLSQIIEVIDVLKRKGAKGFFWIAANKEMVSKIETVVKKCFHKIVCAKTPIFVCDKMPYNKMLIGVNNQEEHPLHYARMVLT